MKTILQALALVAAAFILAHWFTAGQDNIVEGPPVCIDGTTCTTP